MYLIISRNLENMKHQNISEGVKKSWEDPLVRAQRSKRDGVLVYESGKVIGKYSSLWQAFKSLDLPDKQHQKFRKDLKIAGALNFQSDKKVYRFEIDKGILKPQAMTEAPKCADSQILARWLDEIERRASSLSVYELAERAAMADPVVQKIESKGATITYLRNSYVAAYVKKLAYGICDLCQKPAPFLSANAEPYLESHHVTWLSHGGDDLPNNVVALCPNCHRKMHIRDEEFDRDVLIERIAKRNQ